MSDIPAPPQKARAELWARVLFLLGLGLITLGRFYLLRGEDIITNNSGYDDYLFVQLGEHAFWGRPPDEASLVRLPVYPLWVWACHQTGMPLYLGTNVLAVSASLFLVYALRRLHLPRLACVLVYAAILFEFNSIDSQRRVLASNLYGILLLATLAWMALALASRARRQTWLVSAGLALCLGLFAITRAESVLAWVAYGSFLLAFALRDFMALGRTHFSFRLLAAPGLLPALALLAGPLAVASANKAVFGVFTSCSLTSSAFSAVMNGLLAIEPDVDLPYVPVTKDARAKAYAVSPAFAKLKPYLEGPAGVRWGRHAVRLYKAAPEQVGGGWFFFALRRAVISETEARTPAENEAYYRKITEELERAFEEGKLPKRRVWMSLVQPDPTIWRRLPASLGRVFAATLSPPTMPNILDVTRFRQPAAAIEEAFDRVTYRRSLGEIEGLTVSGWGFSNGQTVSSIVLSKRGSEPLPVAFKTFPWHAVFQGNKDRYPSLRQNAPFGFNAVVPVSKQERAGAVLKFVFGDGTETSLRAGSLAAKKFALGSGTPGEGGMLRFDAVTDVHRNRPDLKRATRQLAAAAKWHSRSFKIILLALIPSLILLAILWRSPGQNWPLYLWMLPLLGFVAARTIVLALIDASSFDGTVTQYLGSIAVPLITAAIIIHAQAIVLLRGRFLSSAPAP